MYIFLQVKHDFSSASFEELDVLLVWTRNASLTEFNFGGFNSKRFAVIQILGRQLTASGACTSVWRHCFAIIRSITGDCKPESSATVFQPMFVTLQCLFQDHKPSPEFCEQVSMHLITWTSPIRMKLLIVIGYLLYASYWKELENDTVMGTTVNPR
jgi:hypothetical protein